MVFQWQIQLISVVNYKIFWWWKVCQGEKKRILNVFKREFMLVLKLDQFSSYSFIITFFYFKLILKNTHTYNTQLKNSWIEIKCCIFLWWGNSKMLRYRILYVSLYNHICKHDLVKIDVAIIDSKMNTHWLPNNKFFNHPKDKKCKNWWPKYFFTSFLIFQSYTFSFYQMLQQKGRKEKT